MMTVFLLLHFGSTLYMMGLIWFVQVVHYPLHAHVGEEHFIQYQNLHMNRTSIVVGPPMLVEMATTVFFLFSPPHLVPYWTFVVGAVFLFIVWGSTALFQVPLHNSLTKVFNATKHKRLVRSNWIRTIFWSLRGALVLYTCTFLLQSASS